MLPLLLLACLAAPPAPAQRQVPPAGYRDWKTYGGGAEGLRYSALSQINLSNASRLWRYDSGDEFRGSEMQTNPLVVDGVVYGVTPKLRVIALDAATGKLLWSFHPLAEDKTLRKMRNRGRRSRHLRLILPFVLARSGQLTGAICRSLQSGG